MAADAAVATDVALADKEEGISMVWMYQIPLDSSPTMNGTSFMKLTIGSPSSQSVSVSMVAVAVVEAAIAVTVAVAMDITVVAAEAIEKAVADDMSHSLPTIMGQEALIHQETIKRQAHHRPQEARAVKTDKALELVVAAVDSFSMYTVQRGGFYRWFAWFLSTLCGRVFMFCFTLCFMESLVGFEGKDARIRAL